MKVEFYRHDISERDIDNLIQTLRSTFLTTGPRTAEFERAFADYFGARHCLTFTNWTSAAFLVLKAWGVGPGDEVIVPAMTFLSTSNVVLHCGARPVFVDVEPETGNIDVSKIEPVISDRTKAIIPVHLYGQMSDMKTISDIAHHYNIRTLEDAAHCVEGSRDNYRPSYLSDAACFSFYATKNISCGEGGAVVTNDETLIKKLKLTRLHGMSKTASDRYEKMYSHWDMECLGYKANMSDIQAALLSDQLISIDSKRQRREDICNAYEDWLATANIPYPQVLKGSKSARHLFTFWAPPAHRDQILKELQDMQIGVAVNYRPVHLMKYYVESFGYRRGDFPISESIGDRCITLPLYPKLTEEQIVYVMNSVVDLMLSKSNQSPVAAIK